MGMKAMKTTGKAMTKGAIADSLATEFEIKKGVASKIIDSLSDLASKEVKSATKACTKEIFGKMQQVKAKPARTIVKAFPVAALKNSIGVCSRASFYQFSVDLWR